VKTNIKKLIVCFARDNKMLPELCVLDGYNPDIGKTPDNWVPKHEVLELCKHLLSKQGG